MRGDITDDRRKLLFHVGAAILQQLLKLPGEERIATQLNFTVANRGVSPGPDRRVNESSDPQTTTSGSSAYSVDTSSCSSSAIRYTASAVLFTRSAITRPESAEHNSRAGVLAPIWRLIIDVTGRNSASRGLTIEYLDPVANMQRNDAAGEVVVATFLEAGCPHHLEQGFLVRMHSY